MILCIRHHNINVCLRRRRVDDDCFIGGFLYILGDVFIILYRYNVYNYIMNLI